MALWLKQEDGTLVNVTPDGDGGGTFDGEHAPTCDPTDPATLDIVNEGQLLFDGTADVPNTQTPLVAYYGIFGGVAVDSTEFTDLPVANESINTGFTSDPANGTVTIPEDGLYTIEATASYTISSPGVAGNYYQTRLWVDGLTLSEWLAPADNAFTSGAVSLERWMTAGEVVHVSGTATASTGANRVIGNGLKIRRVDGGFKGDKGDPGEVPEAPIDGLGYLRKDAGWVATGRGRGPYWQGRANAVTVGGGFTTITYASATTNAPDIFSANDPSPGALKVKQSGVYQVTANMDYYSPEPISEPANYTQLELVAEGVGVAAQSKMHASGHNQTMVVSYLWEAAADNYICARHADAAFRSLQLVTDAASQMQITRVGDI